MTDDENVIAEIIAERMIHRAASPHSRIHWRVLATGATGHGSPIVSELAMSIVRLANITYRGEIHHWIEAEA